MTHEQFKEIFDEHIAKSRALLVAKGSEYAPGSDRLSNFKTAAALQGCTPERALWGMVCKHLVALSDFVNALEAGENPMMEWWEEKIGDSVNYLILLKALLIERQGCMEVKRDTMTVEVCPGGDEVFKGEF